MRRSTTCALLLVSVLACCLGAASAQAQSFNLDFGEANTTPAPSYAAAGRAGFWLGMLAPHGSTTPNLVDVHGVATTVSVRQLGGTQNLTVDDPATTGHDEALLDDYLVTFSAVIESCLFFQNFAPGEYEVLIYAWMPVQPTVKSLTSVDQEPGVPRLEVGGSWPGQHQELVTYSRHVVPVGADGILNMHSGLVNGGSTALGAALNAVQIRPLGEVFSDRFELGSTAIWGSALP